MFSSNLLLALAFSVLSVRVQATSQTCTFDLQASEEEPADPATSINNAITGSILSGLRTSDVTVTSTVTGNDPYTAVANITVDDDYGAELVGFVEGSLPGSSIYDGSLPYFVEYTAC